MGRNWHRPCLRCQRCRKTLTAGSHAEVSREGMGGYAGRREAGDRQRAKLRVLSSFSLCPSMTASPTATSPATATCLAPKVGSPTLDTGPKVWHVGLWGCVDNFPVFRYIPGPSRFLPALGPVPRSPKALDDGVLFLRCEYWRCGLLHL